MSRLNSVIQIRLKFIITIVIVMLGLSGCMYTEVEQTIVKNVINIDEVPEYTGKAFIEINGNLPIFDKQEITSFSFEEYGELDGLGRCTGAYANIGYDIMPTQDRGEIGHVKPTGWQSVKYDIVDGRYLYNRCHLIGFQLTGENANRNNLITGTRYMNVEGMLPFENIVADYVRETRNHVLYRVTPIFEGDNMLASGVQLEAMSVEDEGEGICFNVYVYNVQPGIEIDYNTGDSRLAEQTQSQDDEIDFVINKNSKKFHKPTCDSVSDMKKDNRQEYSGSYDELVEQGYTPCGKCF